MISDPGLTLTIYAAEPDSATARALDLLASWTSTSAATDPQAGAPQRHPVSHQAINPAPRSPTP